MITEVMTMPQKKEYPPVLGVAETAELLQVSYRYVLKLIHTKQLKAKKLGREFRLLYADVIAFIDDPTPVAGDPGDEDDD